MKPIRQKDIIQKTGVHQATISNILTGRRRPSWKLAKILAAATDTTPYLWMEGTPDEIREAITQAAKAMAEDAA